MVGEIITFLWEQGVFKGKMVFPLTSKGDEARRTHESGKQIVGRAMHPLPASALQK